MAARNVLIGEDGRPLVTDFGRSRELGGDQGMTKQNLGPIKWSAPEQLEKNLYSKASDVWAFGCLCIELVDREQPWTTSVKNLEVAKYVKDGRYPAVRAENAAAPFVKLINQCFMKEPTQRITMKAFREALERMDSSGRDVLKRAVPSPHSALGRMGVAQTRPTGGDDAYQEPDTGESAYEEPAEDPYQMPT